MQAYKLTFQLFGPDDVTIYEGMVGVTVKATYEMSRAELLARLMDEMQRVLGEKVGDEARASDALRRG